jgi:hypothetical protein
MSEINSVRGHMCEGLKKYQEFSRYSCIPDFSKEGFTRGCDDTNYIPILYCPFCGEKLLPVKLYKCKCNNCENTWETYDKSESECCKECYSCNIEIVAEEK